MIERALRSGLRSEVRTTKCRWPTAGNLGSVRHRIKQTSLIDGRDVVIVGLKKQREVDEAGDKLCNPWAQLYSVEND